MLNLTRCAESELAKTWRLRGHVSYACDEGCHDASHLDSRHALSTLVCDSMDIHALTVRADFHHKSLDIIERARQSKAGLIDATSRLEMLARHREALMLQEDSIAHVWTSSIVGLTALRVLRIAHAHSLQRATHPSCRDACAQACD